MSEDIAIKVENLTKIYKLYASPQDRLKEALNPLRKKYHRDFHALHDVSFDVKQGETFGIIGRNGAGKSTLLKIITGVLTPTSGSATVNGRISALLELGAGFNPQISGLENVYFNGTIMGFSKEEMDAKIDSILAFADIGEFIHQPVRIYSSGMFVRLAFAVAINIDPELLIIDEALSVGDMVFQQKCYRKFKEFQDDGKTILFVSHSLENVIRYCKRAIVLDAGSKIAEGTSKEAVDVYKKLTTHCLADNKAERITKAQQTDKANRRDSIIYKSLFQTNPNHSNYGTKRAEIIDYALLDDKGEASTKFHFDDSSAILMQIRFHEDIENPIFAYTIRDLKGLEITGTNSAIKGILTGKFSANDVITVKFQQRLNLRSGTYSLCLGCTGYNKDELVVYNRLYDILLFDVIATTQTFAVGFFDLHSEVDISRIDQ